MDVFDARAVPGVKLADMSTTNGSAEHIPQTADDAAEQLLGKPFTLDYRPVRAGMLAVHSDGTRLGGLFWRVLYDIESMISHPDVSQPYSYYKSGISTVKFTVKAATEEQAKFAHDLLVRIWERHLDQLQMSYDYGWIPCELTYTENGGKMDLDQVLELHPLDSWALTRRGNFWGFRLKPSGLAIGTTATGNRLQGSVDLWGATSRWPAKGLWLTHNRRFDRYYGRTQLYGAWRPWMRLAGRDGAEDILDGGLYRFAYQGPTVWYPPESFKKRDGGTADYDAARNEARNIAEQAKAGISTAFPSVYDGHGNPLWKLEWPTSVMSGIGTLLDWEKNLQKQISRGVGVPPELLEASDTGSGWSGRKVPLIGFYSTQLRDARNITRAIVDQIIIPLLRWNWGRHDRKARQDIWCDVAVELEVPAMVSGEQPEQEGQQPEAPPQPEPGPQPEQAVPQPEDMPGISDLLTEPGGELSTLTEDDWLDPGWYSGDPDEWSVPIGYELAAPDSSRYQQRKITRGPRKNQSGWYDTKTSKFMPASWSPKGEKQNGGKQPVGKQPGGKVADDKAKQGETPNQKPAAEPPAQPQITEQAKRIADAAKKDLADKGHPLNRMKDRLAVADFGSGSVRTIRPTKDQPLSKGDHEAMDRMHSRTAAALKMAGRDDEANAQVEAAKYHRGLAGSKAPSGAEQKNDSKSQKGTGFPKDSTPREFKQGVADSLEQHTKNLMKNTTARERQALIDYTTDYTEINAAARGRPEDWGEHAATIRRMDKVMDRAEEFKKPVISHRGISVPKAAAEAILSGFRRAAESGQSVGFGGYMSTSIDPDVIDGFAKPVSGREDGASISFEIKAKKGIYVEPMTEYAGEEELLLPRTARYRVVGIKEVTWGSGKRQVVQMEQL